MIFAEIGMEGATEIGIGALVALTIREVVPRIFTYLTGRDKERSVMRADIVQHFQAQLDECKEDHKKLNKSYDDLQGSYNQLRTEFLLLKDSTSRIMEYVITADVVCDVDRKIVSWNEGAEAIFKWAAEEVIGKDVAILIPTRERRKHTEAYQIAVEGRKLSEGDVISLRESYGVRKDGREVPISIQLFVVSDDPLQFGAEIRRRPL